MGIVQNQAFKNTIITYIGFCIGAINVLFLFTHFLDDDYHGLIAFVLSTSNIMMPLFALGVHNAIIKFYSSFKTPNSVNSFLTLMLLLPLLIIIPIGLIGYFSFDFISSLLSEENVIIKDYVWLIFIAAICFSYFEVFYSWAKVQMQSVFGNFMKEVFHRIGVMLLFLAIYMKWLNVEQFIYGVVIVYIIRAVIMMLYAFGVKRPELKFSKIPNLSSIIKYTLLIIIAGSVANIILEIDKFMIGQYIEIEKVAYYSVAIYIATVIGVPARSMHQITNPITAVLLNNNDKPALNSLYKKSSINLFIISGLIFLCIVLNINELYRIIPVQFSGALFVVFLISLAKLFDNLLGINNAILFNSDYYRVVLVLGVILAVLTVILNVLLIPIYGINGAALATFISIVVYNTAKLLFVYYKFKMTPFTSQTAKTLLLIFILIFAFYFWDFSFHPIVNIALKSILICISYVFVVYRFNLSEDITVILNNLLKSQRKI
ncbi:polysaccharide biosynthesis C-terminal domain-containing protein [bacterium AH-315-P13]|nr:polysaccharide biosynthesis C-terminal domain-containing protein [bacterium AH-315-P13]